METILELSKFNHVKYYDGPHKYFIGDRELMSATKFIGMFKPKFEDVSDIFPENKRAMSYLKSRGITQEIIDKYDIGFAYEGDYAGRVIVL